LFEILNGCFDLILAESAGIGQEDLPFARGLVDKQILVMSPDYGSRLSFKKSSCSNPWMSLS